MRKLAFLQSVLFRPLCADVVCFWFYSCRLVEWLPYAPDDIQWLQSITSQICSRAIRHLLPTYR